MEPRHTLRHCQAKMPKPFGEPRISPLLNLLGRQSASIWTDNGFDILSGFRLARRTNKFGADSEDRVDRHNAQAHEVLCNGTSDIRRVIPASDNEQFVVERHVMLELQILRQ